MDQNTTEEHNELSPSKRKVESGDEEGMDEKRFKALNEAVENIVGDEDEIDGNNTIDDLELDQESDDEDEEQNRKDMDEVVVEIGDDETGDEDGDITDNYLVQMQEKLDKADSVLKTKLLIDAVNTYGSQIFEQHEDARDELIFSACILDPDFARRACRAMDRRAHGSSNSPVELSSDEDNDGEESIDDDDEEEEEEEEDGEEEDDTTTDVPAVGSESANYDANDDDELGPGESE